MTTEDSYKANKIVVVGGGTAGWLSALMLSEFLKLGSHKDTDVSQIQITVVESSQIPTVGVGEGTTAVFTSVLQKLGIDEQEFVSQTGATLKFGIKHRDWLKQGYTYDGPIDDPNSIVGIQGDWPWLDVSAVAAGSPVTRHHLFYYLLNLDKSHIALRKSKEPIAVGPYQHAYHFDQARVGAFLKSKAKNIQHIDATVSACEKNEQGNIVHLVTEEGEKIPGDFFLDCTGFKRQLIRGLDAADWVPYSDALPVNRAMPFWLSHDAKSRIPPYTLAWAQKAGWLWMIPTQERMGCGYVYCDDFTNPDNAKSEIEKVLGVAVEPRADIKFQSGRLKQSWTSNCIAMGLASSFLEPLEATSIHATVVQLLLLLQHHMIEGSTGLNFTGQSEYNKIVVKQLDDFKQFLNIHYAVERDDSEFWRFISDSCVTDYNRDRISRWKSAIPAFSEFSPLGHNLPHMEATLYYPVLDGLGILQKQSAKKLLQKWPKEKKSAQSEVKSLSSEYRKVASRALDHAKYLGLAEN